MPTSREMVAKKREADAWEERMRQIRAAEAAKKAAAAEKKADGNG